MTSENEPPLNSAREKITPEVKGPEPRLTASTINDAELDALYAERDRLALVLDENNRRHLNTIARVNELLADAERVRDAARLHRQQLISSSELYAVIEADPAPTEAADRDQTTRVFAALHRSAEQDVTRVIDLYERWVKAGPPPLGTSMARWWDKRLIELHNAILPKEH